MRVLLMVWVLCFAQLAYADKECEKLLCISTGQGRSNVNECKNSSLSNLYQDVWNTYNEDYCYQTNAILNGGKWPCSLSGGTGTVAQVNVYTACIVVYGVKIRVANIVNVNAIPGAIVVGGNGTPIGSGGASANMQSRTVEDDDGDDHTVTGSMMCKNNSCSTSYSVD